MEKVAYFNQSKLMQNAQNPCGEIFLVTFYKTSSKSQTGGIFRVPPVGFY